MGFNKLSPITGQLSLLTLLLFILHGFCINDNPKPTNKTSNNKTAAITTQDSIQSQKIIVYYFYTSYRCKSCTMIEKLTQDAIHEEFQEEINDGELSFITLNIEQDENKHYIQDYKLVTRSVIVSKLVNRKETQWKNLDKIWQLVKKPEQFKQYIKEETKTFLKEKE